MTAIPSSAFQPTPALATPYEAVVLAWGWRRRALAFGAGVSGALAMPSLSFAPGMVLGLSVAVLLIDGAQGTRREALRSAFAAGWFWGFGYFLAGLWWLGAAFLVDADKFAWALPLGVVALPAGLAIFPALGFVLAKIFWSPGSLRLFAFAAALTTVEWLRGVVFTGFPWNDLGMALGAHVAPAQIASLVGLRGLTLIVCLAFAAPATAWRPKDRRWDVAPTALAAAALVMLLGYGANKLATPPTANEPNVRLRIVQPAVAQGPTFTAANSEAILKEYFALSDRATSPDASSVSDVTHVIWPESAFPFLLGREKGAQRAIADFLKGGAVLITGAARADNSGDARPKIFNSMAVVDKTGLRPESYDKRRLVPFGEYLPFESVLRAAGITQFVSMPGGFTAGAGEGLFQPPGLPPALAMICYEAIFPLEWGSFFSPAEASARWILNLTDDAWFGMTPGPHQHFAQARLRAIELGLPLVRAANTGVSAILDGRGRALRMLPLGDQGVIDGPLPKPEPPTFVRRFGSAGGFGLLVLAYALALRGRRGMQ